MQAQIKFKFLEKTHGKLTLTPLLPMWALRQTTVLSSEGSNFIILRWLEGLKHEVPASLYAN